MTNSQNLPSLTETAIISPTDGASDRAGLQCRDLPPKPLAVIYARSRQASGVERQILTCEDDLLRMGLRAVKTYVDIAGTLDRRPGFLEMMADAAMCGFGILVIDDVDRLSRDQFVLSSTFKAFSAAGIEVRSPREGQLHIGQVVFRGLMADKGRALVMQRTRFGKEFMVRQGLSPIRPAHGYVKVPGERGKLAIDPVQAAHVREAFRMRLAGMSVGRIASALDGHASSKGNWAPATVRGLLRNPLYRGILTFGKTRRRKDPRTGRTVTAAVPPAEWVVAQVEHLRIVEDAVWEDVQATYPGPRHHRHQDTGRARP